MKARPYQDKIKRDVYGAWGNGHRNVIVVSPTGSGKTFTFAQIVQEHRGLSMTIAHRQELVSQISKALARAEVIHNIIAPTKLVKWLVSEHVRMFGRNYYSPGAPAMVAGIDTLLRRGPKMLAQLSQVTLWVQDECHHVTTGNKWGTVLDMMPNARGLGVTATPCRTDKQGLGRHASGVFDHMVQGPTMRSLIDQGFLTDYRIFAPPSDLNLGNVTVGATGEYTTPTLKRAVQESHLVGDVVDHYRRIAMGKRGVTFAVDVETATDISNRYNDQGVPSEVVSAKTPDHIRSLATQRLESGELLQLVNVDIFGEGFDLPAIEVVSMARPTQSYGLYVQQFGRALRPLPGKEWALIIDHVGNVMRHGLPDRDRVWSLDDGGRAKAAAAEDDIPLRTCPSCTRPYERFLTACPYCGYEIVPEDRSGPIYVDGDLTELSPEVLAEMRNAVASADESADSVRWRMERAGAPAPAYLGAARRISERHEAVAALRESIAWWAGYQNHRGRSDRESYRIFYHLFGTDVLTAQTLSRGDTLALAEKINYHLEEMYRAYTS